ncbi:MAG: hypothetical protein ACLUUZ_14035 [Blautia wexlerae]
MLHPGHVDVAFSYDDLWGFRYHRMDQIKYGGVLRYAGPYQQNPFWYV